ncbi:iron-sulfur flavoprotein [Clostridium homopropionicum DSM 5847]|uniref:Iron-sulfur flavoprotein n=1 Tax=Clostridium homopropionicum DSM 5847 TaxID=1121318 RepID=A0A0L6Z5H3_9CLOT|nr:flavodoxin family protein [Clostridium homopropionicum]KOA18088.1 iron-sulfur flavoprotein [Clostridium homopropionicum DSM 5847]SFG71584.1 Multimeric flavodoxin WrbA [Clostridium homopropionicum]
MRIISIISSARKNGNTERIVKHIEEDFLYMSIEKGLKAECEQIHLADSDIKLCRGCRVCFDKGEDFCPLKDTLLNIRDKIIQADGVIFASPVYVEDINGIMKNWIDRMAFNCHRPAFAHKTAVIVVTSGGGSSNHSIKTIKSALLTWGFHVSAQGKFRAGALMENDQIKSRYGNDIKVIANKLFSSIHDHRAEYPSFYSLMVFKVQQKCWQKVIKEQNTFDCSYWENKGWLEKTCSYYIPHNSNPIKIKLARIAGSIISIFFL